MVKSVKSKILKLFYKVIIIHSQLSIYLVALLILIVYADSKLCSQQSTNSFLIAKKNIHKATCCHAFFEGIGEFLGFKFGLFLNDFHQQLFPIICIFSKIFSPLYLSKQIIYRLGVTKMLYLLMKIIVNMLHTSTTFTYNPIP